MALLARSVVVAALVGFTMTAGCYDPTLAECKVTCAADGDCAGDQTCGSGGLCVGAGVSTCAAEQPDAGPAPTTVMLHVMVEGKGSVQVDASPLMICGAFGNGGDCMFGVKTQMAHHLVASPQGNRMFSMWNGACAGSDPTCTLTPTMAVAVGAKFTN